MFLFFFCNFTSLQILLFEAPECDEQAWLSATCFYFPGTSRQVPHFVLMREGSWEGSSHAHHTGQFIAWVLHLLAGSELCYLPDTAAWYSAYLPGNPTGSLLSFSAHLFTRSSQDFLFTNGVCSQASCGENIKENHFFPLFPDPWEYKKQIQFNSLTHNTQNTSSDSRNKAITRPLPKLLNNA